MLAGTLGGRGRVGCAGWICGRWLGKGGGRPFYLVADVWKVLRVWDVEGTDQMAVWKAVER